MNEMLRINNRDIRVHGHLLRIARIEGDKYCFLSEDEPTQIVHGLLEHLTRVDLFTFVQKVNDTAPRYMFPYELDNYAALPISTFDNWWNEQLGFKGRNKARQAEKRGVVLREVPFDDDLIKGISTIYNECPIRQGKPFAYYGIGTDRLREYAGTFLDRSIFIGAFFQEELIGFVKLTIDETQTQAGLMHIVSMIQHRDKAPTNALIAQAVRSCAQRKVPYLIYSNFAYGNKQRDSLSDFKERNGFKRVDVPRYYVPVTTFGAVAFRLGMHHRLLERLPESWMARFRDFRSSWYTRRMQASSGVT